MRKTALITGGSRGIGAACVKKFAKEGWNVVFTYNNNSEAADETKRQAEEIITAEGEKNPSERILTLPLDIGQEDVLSALKSIIDQTKTYFGISGLDCCVCNAGVSKSGILAWNSQEDIDELLDANLRGTIMTAKAVVDDMVSKGAGAIILISSIWGQSGASCETVYSATKAGIIGFGKSLALELGPAGVRVNVVAPGVIDTDMNKGYTGEELTEMIDSTPLGRIGDPEDVAEGVFFLASEKASFITGQVLGIDGGIIL